MTIDASGQKMSVRDIRAKLLEIAGQADANAAAIRSGGGGRERRLEAAAGIGAGKAFQTMLARADVLRLSQVRISAVASRKKLDDQHPGFFRMATDSSFGMAAAGIECRRLVAERQLEEALESLTSAQRLEKAARSAADLELASAPATEAVDEEKAVREEFRAKSLREASEVLADADQKEMMTLDDSLFRARELRIARTIMAQPVSWYAPPTPR